MPKPTRAYRPLADSGVDLSVPQYMRKWRALDNTVFERGLLVKRPGLRGYGPFTLDPDSRSGVPQALIELQTNVETLETQRITPTATSLNEWTLVGAATAHEALDDDPPDDSTTYLHTTTDGARIRVSFSNLSNDKDYVEGIVINGRARNDSHSGAVSILDIGYFTGGTPVSLGEVTITGTNAQEADIWNDFALVSRLNPITNNPWTSDEVDGLAIQVQRLSGTGAASERLDVNADGQHTSWTLVAAEGSGITEDYQAVAHDVFQYRDLGTASYLTTSTAAARSSVGFANPTLSFDTVSDIYVAFELDKINGTDDGSVDLFFVGSDNVRYSIATDQKVNHSQVDCRTNVLHYGSQLFEFNLKENPETGNAWQDSELDDLEFGVQYNGGGTVRWWLTGLSVNGVADMQTQITSLNVGAFGEESGGAQIIPKLVITDTTMYLPEKALGDQYTDVNNSLTWQGVPPKKSQWAIHQGKVYVTNGINQIIWYPSTDLFAQFTNLPFGETIASYGGRLILGDVTESSTRNPERLRWSDVDDTDDWSSALAGDLDVHDTPGKFVKIKPHLGSLLAYKTTGLYQVFVQPDLIQPFRSFVRDTETGCIAGETVQSGIGPNGEVVHFFFGKGPGGANIYMYNGSQAIPIGNPIADEIQRLGNPATWQYSFAVVDPYTEMYVCFIPETDEDFFPNQAWAYHLPTSTWRRWTFPMPISAAGVWTIPAEGTGSLELTTRGDLRAVYGATDGFVYHMDKTKGNDDYTVGNFTTVVESTLPDAANQSDVAASAAIGMSIKTGDVFAPDGQQLSGARLHLWYRNRTPAKLTLRYSIDGGETFTDYGDITIGDGTGVEFVGKVEVGVTGISAHRISFEINGGHNQGPDLGQVAIEDFMVELDLAGRGA